MDERNTGRVRLLCSDRGLAAFFVLRHRTTKGNTGYHPSDGAVHKDPASVSGHTLKNDRYYLWGGICIWHMQGCRLRGIGKTDRDFWKADDTGSKYAGAAGSFWNLRPDIGLKMGEIKWKKIWGSGKRSGGYRNI